MVSKGQGSDAHHLWPGIVKHFPGISLQGCPFPCRQDLVLSESGEFTEEKSRRPTLP